MIKMFKTLLKQTKGYRLLSVLCPLLIIVEVYMETQIPFVMSDMVDKGILGGAGTQYILLEGGKMVIMALISLIAGAGAARIAAKAGMGFGSNLRNAIFSKIQDFSFANIDRFSTPSLITRMTTDVNTIQMGYTMVIRMFVRSPIMLVMAFSKAKAINTDLAIVFAVAAPVMLILLALIGSLALPRFNRLMKK
jgi:ATP-binding cassette subfamily B protein